MATVSQLVRGSRYTTRVEPRRVTVGPMCVDVANCCWWLRATNSVVEWSEYVNVPLLRWSPDNRRHLDEESETKWN